MALSLQTLSAENIINNCTDIKLLIEFLPKTIVEALHEKKRQKYMLDVFKYIKDEANSDIWSQNEKYDNVLRWLRDINFKDTDIHSYIQVCVEPTYNNCLCTCMYCFREIVSNFVEYFMTKDLM